MKTKMKTNLFLSLLAIAIGFTACKKDSTDPVETVITETITELNASDLFIFNNGEKKWVVRTIKQQTCDLC